MRGVLIAGACLAAACTPQPEVAQEAPVSASPGFISRDWGATTFPAETTTSTEAPATTTTEVVEVTTTVYVAPRRTTTTAAYVAPARSSSSLASIRACESGGNYSTDTGNGYYGAYQFALSTWRSVGGSGNPAHASPSEQDMRAQMMIDAGRRGEWPNC